MGAIAEKLDGRLFGNRYRLGRKLGHGAMGVVYEAVQESLGRDVAIKVLNPALSGDDGLVARFRAEAERAGKMSHPHIVQVLDFGTEGDGEVWIAMERLRGEPLSARIDRGGMSEHEVVGVAREVLAALAAAHAQRLVHRDLKPDNIYLARVEGVGTTVKVLDFGIAKLLDGQGAAKLTATGVLVGTPLYMAPEQAKGADVDERADLYALGAVMYEALVGQPPFPATNYNALLYAVLTQDPVPLAHLRPGITTGLAAAIARAMSKDPAQRFQSAREMSATLETLALLGSPPPARQIIGTAATLATPTPAVASGGAPTDSLAKTAAESGVGPVQRTVPGPASSGPAHDPGEPMRAAPPLHAEEEPMRAVDAPGAPAPRSAATNVDGSRRGNLWLLLGGIVGGIVVTIAVVGAYAAGIEDASDDDEEGPAVVVPVVPTTAPDPLGPMAPAPAAAGVDPARATTAAEGSGSTAPTAPDETESPVAADGTDARDPRTGRPILDRLAKRLDARAARSRIRVHPSFIQAPGMPSASSTREAILMAYNWSSCWPRRVPMPDVNQSRDYALDVAADGRVTGVSPVGTDTGPPELRECMISHLRGVMLPAPTAGQPLTIRVGFGLDER